jgi:hypothetical protein
MLFSPSCGLLHFARRTAIHSTQNDFTPPRQRSNIPPLAFLTYWLFPSDATRKLLFSGQLAITAVYTQKRDRICGLRWERFDRSRVKTQLLTLNGEPVNGEPMKTLLLTLLLSVFALPLIAQGAPPQNAADQPYFMEYYYKVQWGHQQEFLQLFLKNHYPLLRKEVESGRMLSVKIETPSNHMTEDARWDYRVTIRFKNSTVATTANPNEEAMTRQLWPDQDTYKREEQRRFEILLAHWDLPISDITPAPPKK